MIDANEELHLIALAYNPVHRGLLPPQNHIAKLRPWTESNHVLW